MRVKQFLCLLLVLAIVLPILPANVSAADEHPNLEYHFTSGAAGIESGTEATEKETAATDGSWTYYGSRTGNRKYTATLYENGLVWKTPTSATYMKQSSGVIKITVPEGCAGVYVPKITYGGSSAGAAMQMVILRSTVDVERVIDGVPNIAAMNLGRFFVGTVESVADEKIVSMLTLPVDTYDSSVPAAEACNFEKTTTVTGNEVTLAVGEYYIGVGSLSSNATETDGNKYHLNLASITFEYVREAEQSYTMYLDATKTELNLGTTATVTGVVTDINGADVEAEFTFESSNPEIATVSEAGVVSAVSGGTTVITVNALLDGEVIAAKNITITVTEVRSEIQLSAPAASVRQYETLQLTANVTNMDEQPAFTFASSDTSIATVDENGLVTGLGIGYVTITVSAAGVGEDSIRIFVRGPKNTSQKTGRTYYTDTVVQNARDNIAKYEWAQEDCAWYVENAEYYVENFDLIYNSIPSNGVPRANSIVMRGQADAYTCPYCGTNNRTEYGNYPWVFDMLNTPWKIACPTCDAKFPSNDFGSFYELGLNQQGEFDYMRALEAHREMLIEKGLGDQLSNVKPEAYTDETRKSKYPAGWYEYYGYGVEGGYLYNELYPNIATDTKLDGTAVLKSYETAARWGVDDGWGYGTGQPSASAACDEERYSFIAYYCHYGIWRGHSKRFVEGAMKMLSVAYVYTGDIKYGRAGAIIIDRVADFYPGYNSCPWTNTYANSNGVTPNGGIIGRIWESPMNQQFAKAYDAFWPAFEDPEVIAYLTEKAIKYGYTDKLVEVDGELTVTPETIRYNVEDNLIRGIRTAVEEGRSVGNFGMPQLTMALAAIVLDSHPESDDMLEWIYRDGVYTSASAENGWIGSSTGGGVNAKLLGVVSRDGFGTESSASYNFGWVSQLNGLVKAFSYYDGFEGTSLVEHPVYVAMIQNWKELYLVREGIPAIGDFGDTGDYSRYADVAECALPIFEYLIASDDPVKQELAIEFAQVIYHANGDSVENLPFETLSADPAALGAKIEEIIAEYGEWDLDKNSLLSGYGFAALRSGTLKTDNSGSGLVDTQRDVWMYFGGATSHSNHDNLHIGIDAFGFSITSDHGYPISTGKDPNRYQWTSTTIAHNTVVVDEDSSIKGPDSQKPLYFEDRDSRVNVMDVDGAASYEQTDEYRRTIVMIDYDDENSYSIDFFKILGGEDHLYSFHVDSAIDATYSDNLTFIQQEGGTYAGADVPFGPDPDTVDAWSYTTRYPRGYTWLEDVKRNDNPGTGEFWIDYEVPDARGHSGNTDLDVHFRLTAVNDWNAVEVSLADGYPVMEADNLDYYEHLEYVLVRNTGAEGEKLNTLFTTVLEPYNGERFITNISGMKMEVISGTPADTDLAKAVKVELEDGRIDYVLYAQNSDVTYKMTDETNGYSIEFNGTVGVWTVKANSDGEYENIYSYVCNGTIIGEGQNKQEDLVGELSGQVVAFPGSENNAEALTLDGYIDVQLNGTEIPAEADFAAFAESLIGRIFVGEHDGAGNRVYVIKGVERLEDGVIRLKIGNISLINGYTTNADGSTTYSLELTVGQNFVIPMSHTGCSHNYTNDCDDTCDTCGDTRTPADHTGGTATCQELAKCEVCGEEYGELAGHTGGTATCTEKAKCEVCGEEYGEANGHALTYVPEVPATDTANGTKAHWVCVCGKLYTDAEGKNETTAEQLVIPFNPRSGDSVLSVVVAMLMSAMAIVTLSTGIKKKSR